MIKSFARKLIPKGFKKSYLFIFLTIGIVMIGIFGVGYQAQAAGLFESVGSILGHVAAFIVSWLGRLLVVIINILVDIAQYNKFNSQFVINGWNIVRDLCNMFFIVVLLVIAFGTILGVETYRYKKLLPRFIFMAILINFSKTISLFFIDMGQVVMLTFVNGFRDVAAGNITTGLGLDKMLLFRRDAGLLDEMTDFGNIVAAYLLAIALVIVAIVVTLVMVLVFLFRIIMLWVLVILSPIAYLANILPATQKYAQQWWGEFVKYVIAGPVLAFFLWLSLSAIATTTGPLINISPEEEAVAYNANLGKIGLAAAASEISTTENIFNYMVTIALLVISLIMTQQLGVMGKGVASQAVGRLQTTGLRVPLAPVRNVLGYVGRKWSEKMPTWTNPAALYRGWVARREELKEAESGRAAAKARTWIERKLTRLPFNWLMRPGKKVEIPYEDQVEAGWESEYAKSFSVMTKEQKAEQTRLLWGMGGKEGERRRRALGIVTAEGSHFDDVLEDEWFRKQVDWTDDKGKKHKGFQDEKTGEYYNRRILYNFLKNFMGDHRQGLRAIYNIEEIGKRNTHQEYGGYDTYDSKTGEFDMLPFEERTEEEPLSPADAKGISELIKTPGRKLMGESPHVFVSLRKVIDPETGKEAIKGGRMDRFNKEAFVYVFGTQDSRRITEHSQARTAKFLLGDPGDIDEEGYLNIDETDKDRVEWMLKKWSPAVKGFWAKIGGKGVLKLRVLDKEGKEKEKLFWEKAIERDEEIIYSPQELTQLTPETTRKFEEGERKSMAKKEKEEREGPEPGEEPMPVPGGPRRPTPPTPTAPGARTGLEGFADVQKSIDDLTKTLQQLSSTGIKEGKSKDVSKIISEAEAKIAEHIKEVSAGDKTTQERLLNVAKRNQETLSDFGKKKRSIRESTERGEGIRGKEGGFE